MATNWGASVNPWAKKKAPVYKQTARPPQTNILKQLDYSSYRPTDVRSPLALAKTAREQGMNTINTDPNLFARGFGEIQAGGGYPITQPIFNNTGIPGSGGRGGGGGGGGGAGGLDQATFDWLMAQLQNKPQGVAYRALDLPDPSQYMKWDPSQYGVARQGVSSGIEQMRGRGNQAFDTAVGELNRYQNPFGAGLQTRTPEMSESMRRMAEQQGAMPAFNATEGEGVQADRAMGNALAMLAGNDQARSAANLRATEADRRMMEQNLGLEGNMLNLGVNMSEAKAKTAFDQALQQAMLGAANQETTSNWGRQNEVEATNAATWNDWMNNTLQQILGLVGQKSAGTKLPGDMSWLSFLAPGMNIQAGSQPIPPKV